VKSAFTLPQGPRGLADVQIIWQAVDATSTSARPRRCCSAWIGGSADGSGPSSGGNGSADQPASRNCVAVASARTWRPKPPPTALGGSATVLHLPSPCQMPSSARSGLPPSRLRGSPLDAINQRRFVGRWSPGRRYREGPWAEERCKIRAVSSPSRRTSLPGTREKR
jgi:hypothetical protein